MARKTKVPFADLLEFVRDEKSYGEIRKAVAESGDVNVDRLLQMVDKIAGIRGINTGVEGSTQAHDRG